MKVEKDDRDAKRKEMRNIKENMWKEWRSTREKDTKKSNDEKDIEKLQFMEEILRKLEEVKTRMDAEERRKDEMILREKERRKKWRKEKDAEEAKALVRESEKAARKEKQRKLENRWRTLRWLVALIDKNTDKWESMGLEEEMTPEEWYGMSQEEKRKTIMEKTGKKTGEYNKIEEEPKNTDCQTGRENAAQKTRKTRRVDSEVVLTMRPEEHVSS